MPELTRDTLLTALRGHIGRTNGIAALHLCAEIVGGTPTGAQLRTLRALIHDLRMEGAHICGRPSTGYFVAANAGELEETFTFLRKRAMTSLMQESRMRGISIPDLVGQMRLPT